LKSLCVDNEITQGRSTIGDEKEWNLFTRLDSGASQSILASESAELGAAEKSTGKPTPEPVMERLREMKNAM